jgi:hypothetical protein
MRFSAFTQSNLSSIKLPRVAERGARCASIPAFLAVAAAAHLTSQT